MTKGAERNWRWLAPPKSSKYDDIFHDFLGAPRDSLGSDCRLSGYQTAKTHEVHRQPRLGEQATVMVSII